MLQELIGVAPAPELGFLVPSSLPPVVWNALPWLKDPPPPCLHGSPSPLVSARVSCHFSCVCLCDPKDCSPPGSSVHRILQARILEWVAIPFSRGSSQPYLAGGFFTTEPSGEAQAHILRDICKESQFWTQAQYSHHKLHS